MAPAVSPTEFLKTIWGESQGYAELTAIGKQGVKSFSWTYPGSVDSLLASSVNHNRTANVYMGVCLRREKWPRASGRIGMDGKPIIEHRGTEANAHSSLVVWVEFDFIMADQGHKGRVVEPEMARKWLTDFPLKQSIIIKSGGGIQVYWLLKEPALGDDLWRVKAINKAIVEFFTVEIDGKKYGADTQSVDLARILRIPGSMNVKYTPPRPCEISYWHPENRYLLDDFDFLPIGPVEKPAPAPLQQAAAPNVPIPGQLPSPVPGAMRPIPSVVLAPDVSQFIKENVQAMWLPGHRHDFALRLAGMFAHANVAFESAVAIINGVSASTGGDPKTKEIQDTYNNFVSGSEVSGRTSLENLIDDNWSEDAKKKALTRLSNIAKKLPKTPRPPANGGGGDGNGPGGLGPEPDFQITKIVKFDSRPAIWSVTIVTPEEEELKATVETVNFLTFRLFQAFFYEQTHYMITDIFQKRWRIMIGVIKPEVKETPKEARPEGAIESALEEFLSEARENPDVGMLSSFAGYDDASRFFRFSAFKDFMKEQDIRIENRTIFDHLKHLGFKNTVKRFGPKLQRLWMQPLEGGNTPESGNGHPGGPGIPPEPVPPVLPPPEPQLFTEVDPPMAAKEEKASQAAKAAEISTVEEPSIETEDPYPSYEDEAETFVEGSGDE